MDDSTGPVTYLAIGAAMMWFIDWTVRFWMRSKESGERSETDRILSNHGMSAYFYMPAIGVDDQELRRALEMAAFNGRIVLDKEGRVVGKIIPKVVKASAGPHLRLVVDNSK